MTHEEIKDFVRKSTQHYADSLMASVPLDKARDNQLDQIQYMVYEVNKAVGEALDKPKTMRWETYNGDVWKALSDYHHFAEREHYNTVDFGYWLMEMVEGEE